MIAVAVFGPTLASADPLDSLKPKDCGPTGRVDNLVLRDRMIGQQKIVLNLKLAQALASGSFGAAAAKANTDCIKAQQLGKECGPDQKALQNLFKDALDLVDPGNEDPPAPQAVDAGARHRVRFDAAMAPPVDSERTRAWQVLDGQAAWLSVTCEAAELKVAAMEAEKAAQEAAAAGQADAPKGPSLLSRLVIGAAVTDIAQSFEKRGFATVGYAEDGKKGTDTKTADIMIALQPIPIAGKGTLEELAWTPYAEFERKTAPKRVDELNDLSFGAAFVRGWLGGPVPLVLQADGGWQTDDRFNASLWRGEFSITPPSLTACARLVRERVSFRCSGRALVDYADVRDPGDKTKLKDLPDYARVGLDLEIVYGWQLKNEAVLSWKAAYQARRPIDGSDADAELWTAEIGFAPSKTSNFNISLSYQAGESLNSFTPIEQLQIKLGVRK